MFKIIAEKLSNIFMNCVRYFKTPWSFRSNMIWGFINLFLSIMNTTISNPINWLIATACAFASVLCFSAAHDQWKKLDSPE